MAIRNVTDAENTYALLIDDVNYTTGYGAPTTYRVYRDGELLKELPNNSHNFDDTEIHSGNHTYAVTAVYVGGESMPCTASVFVTGVNIPRCAETTYDVYTTDGKRIGTGLTSLDRLPKGVYIVNNKKITIGRR